MQHVVHAQQPHLNGCPVVCCGVGQEGLHGRYARHDGLHAPPEQRRHGKVVGAGTISKELALTFEVDLQA